MVGSEGLEPCVPGCQCILSCLSAIKQCPLKHCDSYMLPTRLPGVAGSPMPSVLPLGGEVESTAAAAAASAANAAAHAAAAAVMNQPVASVQASTETMEQVQHDIVPVSITYQKDSLVQIKTGFTKPLLCLLYLYVSAPV